jgi:predicted cupin superfamily sugar epimerase
LTATYYLLAERVLSCYRQAEADRLMQLAAAAAAASREMSIDENFPTW